MIKCVNKFQATVMTLNALQEVTTLDTSQYTFNKCHKVENQVKIKSLAKTVMHPHAAC